jgi:hypothetical protein
MITHSYTFSVVMGQKAVNLEGRQIFIFRLQITDLRFLEVPP